MMRTTLAGAALSLLVAAQPGQAAPRVATFNIPAQSAVTAIPEFARQAGLQIVAPADRLAKVRTPRIYGVLDVRDALQRLIADTGLEVAALEGRTVTLRIARAPAPRAPVIRPAQAVIIPVATVDLDPLVVFGGGQGRQAQIVPGKDLDRRAPGSSPLQLVSKLPSVNLSSSDAIGMNEWSMRISVRNFSQGRLGFTLDDIPLGDMTYGNHNGLHISRAISGENIASVELNQGAGALEAASSSNLGGTLKYLSRNPAEAASASLFLAGGSDETARGVLRVESGVLATGLRSYASYAYNTTRRWQGAGQQYVHQVNLKAVQPIGDGSLTALVDASRRRESDPQDLSLGMVRRLGYDWDNIPDDWALAVRLAQISANRGGETAVPARNPAAGVVYPAPFQTVDDAYFDSTTARDDLLAGLTLRLPAGDAVDTKATLYGHWNKGEGLWWTPFVASPNYGDPGATEDNAPISIRSTEYDIRRRGLLISAVGRFGDHTLSAGAWGEENDFVQARRFYGLNLAAPQRDYRHLQSNPFLTEWAYHFSTRTRQAYVQDVWRPVDALTVTAGFKALSVRNRVETRTGPVKDGTIRAENPFLPRVSIAYRLTEGDEVFAHYGRGMRAFSSSNTSGPFAGSAAAIGAIRSTLKPEISESYEVGWRRRAGDVTTLAGLYGVTFRNRLFNTPVGRGIIGNPPALANVGSVSAYGLETALSWEVSEAWSFYGVYAFNHASYDDDVFDGDGVRIARTKGRIAVDAPQHLLKASVDFERGAFFAQVSASYASRRYVTFENDQSVPGHMIADFTAGYRFSGSDLRDGLTAQLYVTNLFDKRYISTLGSNDFAIRGDDLQTVLAGAPRQVFVSLRKAF